MEYPIDRLLFYALECRALRQGPRQEARLVVVLLKMMMMPDEKYRLFPAAAEIPIIISCAHNIYAHYCPLESKTTNDQPRWRCNARTQQSASIGSTRERRQKAGRRVGKTVLISSLIISTLHPPLVAFLHS